MRQLWRHTAILAMTTYVMAGILLEIVHDDGVAVSLRNNQILAGHDCGNKEIHVALDQIHPCTACTQKAQRTSPLSVSPVSADLCLVYSGVIPAAGDHLLESHFTSSGTRGPPPA